MALKLFRPGVVLELEYGICLPTDLMSASNASSSNAKKIHEQSEVEDRVFNLGLNKRSYYIS
jgi:hypothetical protein